jgi:2'-5' RNA ligase
MSERWRCFVAVPVDDALRRRLEPAVAKWRGRPDLARLRWADPVGWHVTLAFLGSTDPARVEHVAEAARTVAAGHHAIRLATGGVGAFPTARRARVAWYGVTDPGELRTIAEALALALGLPRPDAFHPHVTLARARREPIDARRWIDEAVAPTGELAVDRIELMRSHTGTGPARYETLASHRLEVPAGV